MGEKISEVTKYLYGCFTIEKEISDLYLAATKKLPCQQLSLITLSIAYDNQKHVAVLNEILKPLLQISISKNLLSEEFKVGFCEVSKLHNTLIMKGDMDSEDIDCLLNNLTNIEDYLYDLYANLIDFKLMQDYSTGFLDYSILNSENLFYILKTLKQDNLKHRRMLIDGLYFYKRNFIEYKDTTPIVRYQNPEAWVHH